MDQHFFIKIIFTAAFLLSNTSFAKGTLGVVNKGDNSVSFINLSTGKMNEVKVGLLPHEIAVTATHAYVSNYGKQHVRSKSMSDKPGNHISVISLNDLKRQTDIHLGPKTCAPHGLFALKNKPLLYVTCEAREEVLVINTITHKVIKSIATNQAGSHMITVNSQQTKAYVTNFWIGTVSVLDLTKNKLEQQISVGRSVEGVTVSPGGDFLYVSTVESQEVIKVDTATSKIVSKITLEDRTSPIRLLITPDGRRLIGNNAGKGSFSIYNADDLSLITEIKVGDLPIGLAMSTDGERAFVANMKSSSINIIDINKGFIIDEIKTHSKAPDGIAFID